MCYATLMDLERDVEGQGQAYPSVDDVTEAVEEGDDVTEGDERRCKDCCKRFVTFLFSSIGMMVVMTGYTILGGFIFQELEAPQEVQLKSNVKNSRHWHAEKLWNITLELNILHADNWTQVSSSVLLSSNLR